VKATCMASWDSAPSQPIPLLGAHNHSLDIPNLSYTSARDRPGMVSDDIGSFHSCRRPAPLFALAFSRAPPSFAESIRPPSRTRISRGGHEWPRPYAQDIDFLPHCNRPPFLLKHSVQLTIQDCNRRSRAFFGALAESRHWGLPPPPKPMRACRTESYLRPASSGFTDSLVTLGAMIYSMITVGHWEMVSGPLQAVSLHLTGLHDQYGFVCPRTSSPASQMREILTFSLSTSLRRNIWADPFSALARFMEIPVSAIVRS